MMKRLIVLALIAMCWKSAGFAQDQPKDTTVTMPKLEIPEITIVGKKAITLPFARKGEIYDVNIFQAPPPDSSLLGERMETAMPVGSMPVDEEKRDPLHASAEGAFGNYSTGAIRAYLDYLKGRWKFFGNAGFASTEGYTSNGNASSFDLAANMQSLFTTDNNALKTLQLTATTKLLTEKYGMFAFSDVQRNRQDFSLDASLNSIDRRGITIDLGIGTNFWSLTDDNVPGNTKTTAVSPKLTSAFAMNIGKVRWNNDLMFTSISLDYSTPTQSVTLVQLASSAHWNLTDAWSAEGGLVIADGSDLLGSERTIALPTAKVQWDSDDRQQFSFFWMPGMQLNSYDYWTRYNPYLMREINLEPERIPVNLGITYSITKQSITFDASVSFTQFSNKGVILGSSSLYKLSIPAYNVNGNLWLEYVEANQTRFELSALYRQSDNFRVNLSGLVEPTYATGSSDQLPMTPLLKMNVKAEYDLPKPVTLWASLEMWSEQNVDLMATRTLDGAVLLNAGASTTIVPRTLISASLHNLLGMSYAWWAGYQAPGFQFSLEAKVNLK